MLEHTVNRRFGTFRGTTIKCSESRPVVHHRRGCEGDRWDLMIRLQQLEYHFWAVT